MSTPTRATVALGRDGMGPEVNETDFWAWQEYVTDRIDEACGFSVEVEGRRPRDVQNDDVRGYEGDDGQIVRDALVRLWEAFCTDDSAWPKREEKKTKAPDAGENA